MKYFKRKAIMSILFLFCCIMILFSALLQLTMHNNNAAFFQILVAFLFAYDAYVYNRPYLGLNKEQLIINNGLLKKEIVILKNVSSVDEKSNKLILTYNQDSTIRKIKILLFHLKGSERKLFTEELRLNLAKLGQDELSEQ